MFQINDKADRALVEEELSAWRAEQRRLLLRVDAQLGMKEALGRCNEEAVTRFTAGLEECAYQIRYFEAILAATPPEKEGEKAQRMNGVHA